MGNTLRTLPTPPPNRARRKRWALRNLSRYLSRRLSHFGQCRRCCPCYVRKRYKRYPHYFLYSPSARYRSRCKLGGPSCPVTVLHAKVGVSIAQDDAAFSSQAFSPCSSFVPSLAWRAIIAFSVGHSMPTLTRNAQYPCVCHSICHAQGTSRTPIRVAEPRTLAISRR
jgi:hypothetical protein